MFCFRSKKEVKKLGRNKKCQQCKRPLVKDHIGWYCKNYFFCCPLRFKTQLFLNENKSRPLEGHNNNLFTKRVKKEIRALHGG